MSRWLLICLIGLCVVAMATAGHHRRASRRSHSTNNMRRNDFPNSRWRTSSSGHQDNNDNHKNGWQTSFDWSFWNLVDDAQYIYQRHDQQRGWWSGPNVCERKTESVKNKTDTGETIQTYQTSISSNCDISETAYTCYTVESSPEMQRERKITYECCHGFEREEGDHGCPTKLRMKNLVDTAKDMGLTEFVEAVEMLELTNQLKSGNLTIFAPINGAFGLDEDFIGTQGNTKFLMDSPSALEVTEPALERTLKTLQGAFLGHVLVGAHRSSNLMDEQVVETGHPDGSTIRINYFSRPAKLMTANCIPVESRDNMATNGVIHTIKHTLKPVTQTLLDLVRTRSDLTMLKTVLAAAAYVPKLEEEGKYTLIAPTNNAFKKMSPSLKERLMKGDKECIEKVLLNHILPNVICSSAFQKTTHTLNLLDKYINVIRNDDNKFFANDAQVVKRDIMALNGVMHIVDDVIIPQEALDLLEVMEQKGLSELSSLIQRAGLTKTLESAKNVTIFAPTNEAIQKLPLGLKSKLMSDKDLLKKVLTYHVSPNIISSKHFPNNQLVPSLEGRTVRLNRFRQSFFTSGIRSAQCAGIEGINVKACNGQLILLSEVMTPPKGNVVDVLAADKRFSTLISLLKKADLVHILEEDGPFTFFAPNNKAFDKLDKRTMSRLQKDPESLTRLLKSHVLNEYLCCAGFPQDAWFGGLHMNALSGRTIELSVSRRGTPKVSDLDIVKCDRTASNGNVLEIDEVLFHKGSEYRRHFWRHNRNHWNLKRNNWRRHHRRPRPAHW